MNNKTNKYILGISAFYHDAAAVLIKNDEIIAAAQEERFTRRKHDESFPANAIKFCLDFANISLDELKAVVFYEKPFIKFERIIESYYIFAPDGLKSFLLSIPVWVKEKLLLKKIIKDELSKIGPVNKKNLTLLFSNHHLSHAASAFYPSPFKKSAILTVDGVGEWSTASIAMGDGNKIKTLKELKFPHSLGLLYSAFTYFLGFKVNSGEYKLMGLAPYGDPGSDNLINYKNLIKEYLVHIKDDGSIWLNQNYFNYAVGLKMVIGQKWQRLFGFPRREEESEIEQKHCDLALAIQQITEEIILKMAETAKQLTNSENLCMAGGVALNCVANTKIVDKKVFKNIWIQPAAGDAGGALGAALSVYYIYFENRRIPKTTDTMKGSYLGPMYENRDIENMLNKFKAHYVHFDNFNDIYDRIAGQISKGKVIGWFQGRMEWGPRALGNRSIIADARNKQMQKKLNLQIKYREGFRPFAPAVLSEDAKDYFNIISDSPYMLLISDVAEKRKIKLPKNYHKLPLKDKLYFTRSDIPAVTHLDYSARLQTVHKDTNGRFWNLLNKFKEKTGYGLLINTSFNRRGEPIVCTPEDAYNCFMRTDMDFLVIENFIIDKKEQTNYNK